MMKNIRKILKYILYSLIIISIIDLLYLTICRFVLHNKTMSGVQLLDNVFIAIKADLVLPWVLSLADIVLAVAAVATFIFYYRAMGKQNEIIENELYMPARQKHSEDLIENVIGKLKYVIKDALLFFGINQFNLGENSKDFLSGDKPLNDKDYNIETLFNTYIFNNINYNFLGVYYYLKNKDNPPIPTNSYNLYIDFIKNHQPQKIDEYNKENIDLNKALEDLIDADIEFSKKITYIQNDFQQKIKGKFGEYKTANPDIFNSACGDKSLSCDDHETFPLFKVLYDYRMKLLGYYYNFTYPAAMQSLNNKYQLIESFSIKKAFLNRNLHPTICFDPPAKYRTSVIGFICAVHTDENLLKEFLLSVKEFVNEMSDDDLKDKGIESEELKELKALKKKVEGCKQKVNDILDILGKKVIFQGDCDYIK